MDWGSSGEVWGGSGDALGCSGDAPGHVWGDSGELWGLSGKLWGVLVGPKASKTLPDVFSMAFKTLQDDNLAVQSHFERPSWRSKAFFS